MIICNFEEENSTGRNWSLSLCFQVKSL